MLFAVMEYGSVDESYTFPSRQGRFDLGSLGGPTECWGLKNHLILFEDGGRYFQAQVVFGDSAPASLRDDVLRSLDSLQIDPLPSSEQPAAKCRAGQWTSCPEAARVFEVMNAAHVFHLGHRGDDAILGLAHGRSFSLWTTRAGGPAGGHLPRRRWDAVVQSRRPGVRAGPVASAVDGTRSFAVFEPSDARGAAGHRHGGSTDPRGEDHSRALTPGGSTGGLAGRCGAACPGAPTNPTLGAPTRAVGSSNSVPSPPLRISR
jgi:hypothetical protein